MFLNSIKKIFLKEPSVDGTPTKKRVTPEWLKNNGFENCMLCGKWMKKVEVSLLHPICEVCTEEGIETSNYL